MCGGKDSCSFKGSKKCCCSTTSLDILKSAVSEKSCCSSKQARICVYNYDPVELTFGNVETTSIPFSKWDMDTIQGFIAPGSSGLSARQIKALQAGLYMFDFLVMAEGVAEGLYPAFAIKINGSLIPGTTFTADKPLCNDACPGPNAVIGLGLINLKVDDIIELSNVSGSGASVASLPEYPPIPQGDDSIGNPNTVFRLVKTC